MSKKLLAILAGAFICTGAVASPLWMRYNAISPDGRNIAFTYKGDIYVVAADGGQAVRITSPDAYDFAPVWSHDGSMIAYASDRTGNFDVWVEPAKGGLPTRLTTNSTEEIPMSFSPDDKSVLYTARIQKSAENVQFSAAWLTELYSSPITGGRPRMVTSATVCSVDFDADGESFIYYNRKGSENIWRKHQVSSVARDLVYYNAKDGSHTILTSNVGEDRDPMYLPGHKEIVFLSERDGKPQNVYRGTVDAADKAVAVTDFGPYPVRFLTVADNGTLCYGYQGEIYTQKIGSEPRKVNIDIVDDHVYSIERAAFGSASNASMTPDGKQIAFSARGEIFVTSDEYATTRQISHTAAADDAPSFAPDGKSLVYHSERDGYYNLYMAKMTRKEEENFAYATLIEEKRLFPDDGIERSRPVFSPDGKEIAFIEGRNVLKVLNLASGDVRQITDGKQHFSTTAAGFSFAWSPDGKWFAVEYVATRHQPYNDIAVVSASGDMKIHPVTLSGYTAGDPKWVLDGNAIIFTSERYGMRSHASWGSQDDAFIAFMNQDAYDRFRLSKEEYEILKAEEEQARKETANVKKDEKSAKQPAKRQAAKENTVTETEKKGVEIDTEHLMDRVVRLTPMSSSIGDIAMSKDGDKLYFTTSFEKGKDLWQLDVRERNISKFKDGVSGKLHLSKDGKTLYVLGGNMQKITLAGGKSTPIKYNAMMELDHAAERKYMFDHVFLQENKRLFLQNSNGADMKQIKKDFEPFLEHIDNIRDFSEMLSEVLGELNVSHSGSRTRLKAKPNADATATFGLIYSKTWAGDGLKVDEIIAGGPFDRKVSKLSEGDVIEKIDGVAILADTDYYPMLNHKNGVKTLVSIYSPATGERWEETVKPISASAENDLMYQRWIKHNAEEVERLSGGRLGYVHIKSMNDESFREVYSDILGKYNLKDGIVVDTRFNGGGRLHEDVQILFSGKKYLEQIIDGRVACEMPSRRYNKPSIMIQGEANYSNAHGTPWVYKHEKIGKLVGMPVPGTMSSVTWETLQDPEVYYGLPVVGYRTAEGGFLENDQLDPDIMVRNSVEALDKGEDTQLKVAVEELLRQMAE